MKISIITVCRNSAATIGDTLASVRDQTHPDVEHIVVDGASTDGTADIVRAYPHVAHFVSEPDRGLYDAMNKGIRMATGDVVGVLNSDDFYASPHVLARVICALLKSGADTLYADLNYVHPHPPHRTIRHWRSGPYRREQFRYGWMPPHPTFFVRREHYEIVGTYDPHFRISADYELMLRFLYKQRLSACYLPEVLVQMRAGGVSNSSLRRRWHANREDHRAWIQNGLQPAFFTLWLKPVRKIPQFLIYWPLAIGRWLLAVGFRA
ncbi:MAG: glycosyltransferase family 2 protein [Saprospiraceae bacterium]